MFEHKRLLGWRTDSKPVLVFGVVVLLGETVPLISSRERIQPRHSWLKQFI